MSKTDGVEAVKQFKKIDDYTYAPDGELPIPGGDKPGPGQFSKDGLHYFFSLEIEIRGYYLAIYAEIN